MVGRDGFAAVGNGLIEDGKAIAHAAFGGPRHQCQRIGFKLHLLLFKDAGEMVGQRFGRDALQVEALAA